ncbi:ArsR/SmtB family transcription factor [Paenibacillus whitsoniae]|uniref:Winged helix-turn-helix transcriptional regulator n=1 Tax=Paenibacillus whitsoniae TaxID=2496558 RepID=A0A430JGU8_9BACL|nr:winged helix-turn-helix transcriptional regulator [Paenibacillus whitsoniae]RTE10252.1 winged helix-turn-helix transcriptional regulator [Paenibacillus whitsoniae]
MLELSINEPDQLVAVAHALSSHTRINIIKLLLQHHKLNIIEIAEMLKIPVSTTALNVKVLEESGLILTELQPASRGAMKVCSRNFDDVHMCLNPIAMYKNPNKFYEIEMPIGHFTNFEVFPTCGMANLNGMVIPEDDPVSFYHPESKTAEIIWLRQGWIEYRFPKVIPQHATITSIEFSLEICSEAPNYNNEWPSDITVWVNGIEIGTWTSPGDFGDHRGKHNPLWWNDSSTQYGILKTWRVDEKRSSIDNEKSSSTSLADLHLEKYPFIEFKIGVKPDALHHGGINLFGRGFGDYAQAIVMKIQYV